MSDHPSVRERVERLMRRKALELSRCFKACFLGELGEPTLEAERAIADLRKFAKLDDHSFMRDLTGRIDPIGMARIEGRREVVQRMIRFLELDPRVVGQFVEVDNGHD
jgi:hypothetical protein